MPVISIALATYNGERYLDAQLDSFLCQSRPPDEVVVCDDGSSDGTLEILHRFQRVAPFNVQLLRNGRRLGHIKNFERALSLCEGELIFLSDQDDVWFENKLSIIETMAADSPALLYVNDLVNLLPGGRLDDRSFLEIMEQQGTSARALVKGCSTALDSRLLKAALPVPDGYSHDKWLHHLASALDSRRVVQEVLQGYRVHDSQQSGGQPKARVPNRRLLQRRTIARAGISVVGRLRHLELLHGRVSRLDLAVMGLGDTKMDVRSSLAKLEEGIDQLRRRQSYINARGATRVFLVGKEFCRPHHGAYTSLPSAMRDAFFP